MSAEHMLLPRGGYDFIQISPTEYRWSDADRNRSAVVMAPEGRRFGWYFHVRSGSPERNYLGRKASIDAAFRQAVLSLDLLNSTPGHSAPGFNDSDGDHLDKRVGQRPARSLATVNRQLDANPVMKMVRALSGLKEQNG